MTEDAMMRPGYCIAVYADYAIVEWKEQCWRIGYSMDETGKVTLAERDTWQQVERQWVAKTFPVGFKKAQEAKAADMLVVFGGEIKALGEGKVGGYLVRFTNAANPDLAGDYFTKDTDLDVQTGDPITIYYNHGFDPVLKTRKLGKGAVSVQELGVWVEAQLQMRDEYEQAIYQMAERGRLGWSSGTLSYLVEREPKGGNIYWIKSWPLGKDASLTPTPAAGPILTAVQPLKSWAEATRTLQALTPQTAGDAATRNATENGGKATDTRAAKRLLLELELLTL